MDFEWDDAKDQANRAKYGIGFAEAARLDWARGHTALDGRRNYGELRYLTYAHLGDGLYVCLFTPRGLSRRIISLRKANQREIKAYGQET
jgi:uncharacterized protein